MLLRMCFLFFCIVLLSNISYSDQSIDFGSHVKLTYKNGNLNKDTYNGFASNVSLFEKEKLFGTIKTLKIDSQKTQNGKTKINFMSLKGITLFDDDEGFKITIEKFEVSDLGPEIFQYDFSSGDVPNDFYKFEEHKNFSLNLTGIKIESNDFDLKITSINFPKIKYGVLSSGQDFAKKSNFEMNGFSFIPNPENIEMLPLNLILASIGQQSLKLDLLADTTVDDKGLLLDMISKFEFNIHGAASLKTSFNYLVPIEAYNNFYNNSSLLEEMQSQNFDSLNSSNFNT